MVGTVKTKAVRSLSKGEHAVLLPGLTGAEPWELWILSGQAQAECVQICTSPLDNRLRKNSTLALPVSQVFCLALWLNETDPKQFPGIITLQLELRGLQPRGNGPAIFDWSVVVQEGTRTLVMVGVLPATMPQDMQAEVYQAFDLSARYLSFPENAMTLWQEQDHLAVAMTRGSHLVYYQILPEMRVTQRVLQDLNCIRATLEMQDILPPLQQAVVWMETSPVELNALRAALPVPVNQAERPSPRLPVPAWKLTPAVVGEAKKTREIQRWRNRGILIALIIYLLLVGLAMSQYIVTSRNIGQLAHWKSDHEQALALVHNTTAAWKELEPVVAEKDYPLEVLLNSAAAIPADQLRLTLFESNNDHILIKGEAKNASASFQYLENLKSNPALKDFSWAMSAPRLLPNDLAQFQIDGVKGASN